LRYLASVLEPVERALTGLEVENHRLGAVSALEALMSAEENETYGTE